MAVEVGRYTGEVMQDVPIWIVLQRLAFLVRFNIGISDVTEKAAGGGSGRGDEGKLRLECCAIRSLQQCSSCSCDGKERDQHNSG